MALNLCSYPANDDDADDGKANDTTNPQRARRAEAAAAHGGGELGVSQTKLNVILNGHRRPPAGFAAEAKAALDRLERAERAAAETRAGVLGGAA